MKKGLLAASDKANQVQHCLTWSAEGLAAQLGCSADSLRRKAAFWVKHGVLIESQGRAGRVSYTRAQSLSSGAAGGNQAGGGAVAMEEDEGGSALVSVEDQLKKVYTLSS